MKQVIAVINRCSLTAFYFFHSPELVAIQKINPAACRVDRETAKVQTPLSRRLSCGGTLLTVKKRQHYKCHVDI